MKLKKLACLAMAVMMMAVLAVSASAATLSVTKDYTAATAGSTDYGTAYAYNVKIVESSGLICLTVEDGCTLDTQGAKFDLNNGVASEVKMPYVTYKVSADDAKCIDDLILKLYGHTNAYGGGNFYQVGVYVTSSFTPAEDGSYDFSALTPAKVYGGTEASTASDLTKPGGEVELDLSSAVDALGESQDVYVTLALNLTWRSGTDYSRMRVFTVNLEATQKAATVTDNGNDNEGETNNPATSDTAVLAAVSIALISGAAIVVTRKKAH